MKNYFRGLIVAQIEGGQNWRPDNLKRLYVNIIKIGNELIGYNGTLNTCTLTMVKD